MNHLQPIIQSAGSGLSTIYNTLNSVSMGNVGSFVTDSFLSAKGKVCDLTAQTCAYLNTVPFGEYAATCGKKISYASVKTTEFAQANPLVIYVAANIALICITKKINQAIENKFGGSGTSAVSRMVRSFGVSGAMSIALNAYAVPLLLGAAFAPSLPVLGAVAVVTCWICHPTPK